MTRFGEGVSFESMHVVRYGLDSNFLFLDWGMRFAGDHFGRNHVIFAHMCGEFGNPCGIIYMKPLGLVKLFLWVFGVPPLPKFLGNVQIESV